MACDDPAVFSRVFSHFLDSKQKGVKSFMKSSQLELYWLNSGDPWKIVCFMAFDDLTVFSRVFSLLVFDSTQKGSNAL